MPLASRTVRNDTIVANRGGQHCAKLSFEAFEDPSAQQMTLLQGVSLLPRTTEETVALVWAVEKVGGGKWAEIKKMKYPESDPLERRSAVDLKDKWRNLQVMPGRLSKVQCFCCAYLSCYCLICK